MNHAGITRRVREEIHLFSRKLSDGLPKVVRRFVGDMIYGIQTRGSVRLSEIGRALHEQIPPAKTIDRLSRNPARPGMRTRLGGAIMREGARRIARDSLLVVDISDISKKYARRMDYMARVHDGSTGGVGDGYWMMHVVGGLGVSDPPEAERSRRRSGS